MDIDIEGAELNASIHELVIDRPRGRWRALRTLLALVAAGYYLAKAVEAVQSSQLLDHPPCGCGHPAGMPARA